MKFIHFFLFTFSSFSIAMAQCTGNEPTVDLGPDTVLCFGQNLSLSVSPGYDFYQWSNGSTGTSINVTQPGTYSVTAGTIGTNQLIVNGDFSGGTTAASNNFSTSYIPGTGGSWGLLSNPGQYAISTSPSLTHNNFASCGDHTSGTGNMMIVNGATTLNTNVWSQTVAVTPNENYIFSFWTMKVAPDPNLAQLQLFINNSPISSVVSTSSTSCVWTQITGVWNSGSATTANLSIFNQVTSGGGNDFAIDDIFFANNCVNQDTVEVTMEIVTAYAGIDRTFCPGEADSIFGTTNNTANSLIWDANGAPGNAFLPDTTGLYTLTAISPAGCTYTDNVMVTIKDMNWSIADIIPTAPDCGMNNGGAQAIIDTLDFNDPDPLPFSYAWTANSNGGSVFGTNSNVNNLNPGWYYLTVTSNGCSLKDSVEILTANAPIAAATVTPNTGYGPLTVTFDNQSQFATNYTWFFDTISNQSTTSTDPIDQTFTEPGTYTVTLIASNGNCFDTVMLTVVVLPPPIEPVFPIDSLLVVDPIPNVFSPNGDFSNDIFTFGISGARSFEINIFNRWGNIVYTSKNPIVFGWDGKDATDGIYFYNVLITGYQGEERKEQGFLHLVR